MATQTEVDILLKTVADTSGAQQVQNALQQTQQAATQTQQQLSLGQTTANRLLQGLMQQHGASSESFAKAVESITRSIGVRPTLTPESFGIKPIQEASEAAGEATEQATTSVRGLGLALRDVRGIARGNVTGMAEMRTEFTALANVVPGLARIVPILGPVAVAAAAAGAAIHQMVVNTAALELATRQNTVVLGNEAQAFQVFATTVSRQTGVARDALLAAGTAAAQFSQQVGLPPQSLENLTAMATILARIHGLNVDQSMSQLTAAMQGNAQAAQALGLNLDAAYVAYTQLGGAVSDVFNLLDPSTQSFLRYQAALQQTEQQARMGSDASMNLAAAMSSLGTAMSRIWTTVGPPVVELLALIVDGFANAANVVGDSLQIMGQGLSDFGTMLHGIGDGLLDVLGQVGQALAAFAAAVAGVVQVVGTTLGGILEAGAQALAGFATAVRDTVLAVINGVFSAAAQALAQAGGIVTQINDLIKQATGVDVLGTLGQALAQAGASISGAIDAITTSVDNFSASDTPGQIQSIVDKILGATQAIQNPLTLLQPFIELTTRIKQQVADAAAAAAQAGQAQLANLLSNLAGPLSQLAGARAAEQAAAQNLVDLKFQSVQLSGEEARIRLGMLPAQQEMARLQNEVNRAQIEAAMRALPASRQLQQVQLELNRLQAIAQDPTRAIAERQAAQVAGAQLELTVPRLTVANIEAQQAQLPYQYAAQDVGYAAQLQQLQQAGVLMPLDFAKQQIDLLTQMGQAVLAIAQRGVEVAIQEVRVIIQQTGPITPDDEKQIAEIMGTQVAAAIHQAVTNVGTRPALGAPLVGVTP